MRNFTIPDREFIEQEIKKSQKRSEAFILDQGSRKKQVKLKPEELEIKRAVNSKFLDIARDHIRALYRFVEGAGFAVTLADHEGYILETIGDKPIIESMAEVNCTPGYRWTEKDVGTSAISLVLKVKHPLQIAETDHYLPGSIKYTCSSSPIFSCDNKLIGIIALTGLSDKVGVHTLGMVITSAVAIENQLYLTNALNEIEIQNNYLTETIGSLDNSIILIDNSGLIRTMNNSAKKLLNISENDDATSIYSILPKNFTDILFSERIITFKEIFITKKGIDLQLVFNSNPVKNKSGEEYGYIINISEIKRIKKIINTFSGTRAEYTFSDISGESKEITDSINLAVVAAMNDSTVLIQGETGTGKEVFAQAIHNRSSRRNMPFVAINCGAIPRDLLESELFGYSEGAFTGAKKGGRPGKFEIASGGTVFLDEIGDMPVDMQVKLLRVLQTGVICRIGEHNDIDVKVRIIAATNVNLQNEVKRKNFREDLYYRLNVFPIKIPALRDRESDIVIIAREILTRRSLALKNQKTTFSPEAENLLMEYSWPGNIRELENVIERVLNITNETIIDYTILSQYFTLSPESSFSNNETGKSGTLLEDVEKNTIINVLNSTNCNISKSSEILGITRATLYKKINKHKITV